MATPQYATPNQDMPPPGGYKVAHGSHLPARRGPPGWAVLLGVFAMSSFGYYMVGQTNKQRRALAAEERERRVSIASFLQAEADVNFLRQNEQVLASERQIMKDVPGWEVGKSVYHSKRFQLPLYARKE